MIRVTIELMSAITGKTTLLGRMFIWNKGDSEDKSRGNYSAVVLKKGYELPPNLYPSEAKQVTRRGHTDDYPRNSYNVWRLVIRILKSAFPEER